MEFTKEERTRIDTLYASDFKGATPDDVQLIARFARFLGKQEAESDAYIQTVKEESAKRVAQAKRISDMAIKNLNELHDAAIAHFGGVGNGK
jgi:archaellum component FlaC